MRLVANNLQIGIFLSPRRRICVVARLGLSGGTPSGRAYSERHPDTYCRGFLRESLAKLKETSDGGK
jgi:hypothetical protein